MVNSNSFPDFLCVGSQRSGTTYLHYLLKSHPDISVPKVKKEIHFFDKHYNRGFDWYERNWDVASNKIKGEVTPEYMWLPEARERIKKCLPNTKIIISLRNPISRLTSSYKRFLRNEGEKASFEYFLSAFPSSLQRGLYYEQVKFFIENYHENVCILIQEKDFEGRRLAKKLGSFLCVDSGLFNGNKMTRKNEGAIKKFPKTYAFGVKLRKFLIDMDCGYLVLFMEKFAPRKLFNSTKKQSLELDERIKKKLINYFADDVIKLEKLIDRKLLDVWLI